MLRVNASTALKLIKERGTEHSAQQWGMGLLEYLREQKEQERDGFFFFLLVFRTITNKKKLSYS